MLNRSMVIFFFAYFLVCNGCGGMNMDYGKHIPITDVSSLVKGKTTRSEVEQRFGIPAYTTMMSDGRSMATYSYTKVQTSIAPQSYVPVVGLFAGGSTSTVHTQTLIVTYDKNALIEDYTFSQGGSTGQSQGLNVYTNQNYNP